MVNEILDEARESMDKAVGALKKEMTKVRTGRASTNLLDDVRVEYYGVPTPLSQVATLSARSRVFSRSSRGRKTCFRRLKKRCSRLILA